MHEKRAVVETEQEKTAADKASREAVEAKRKEQAIGEAAYGLVRDVIEKEEEKE